MARASGQERWLMRGLPAVGERRDLGHARGAGAWVGDASRPLPAPARRG
jgi:hypothetical protein